jgi:hypothetical protein
MRREKTQISKIRNEKGEITTNTKDIHGIIRYYLQNLHYNELENLGKMDRFLYANDHTKLNQDAINHLNGSITLNEIEAEIRSLHKK